MFGDADTGAAITLLRFFLLAGLVVHKAVWEFMKRGAREPGLSRVPPKLRLVRAAKVGILAGIIFQTLLPYDLLPVGPGLFATRAAGALLYTAGLALAIAGRVQLGRNWSDIEAARLNQGHQLVASGVYRYVRHPIYAGDLLLLLGLEVALNSWLVVGVMLLIVLVARKAVLEEAGLLGGLPEYADYCARTKRFIPFVF